MIATACAAGLLLLLLAQPGLAHRGPRLPPDNELIISAAALRKLAEGPACSVVCGMKLRAGAFRVEIDGKEECVYSPESAQSPKKALQCLGLAQAEGGKVPKGRTSPAEAGRCQP